MALAVVVLRDLAAGADTVFWAVGTAERMPGRFLGFAVVTGWEIWPLSVRADLVTVSWWW